jgi:5-methylcytosine-specific restriction endonuclease McrA
MARDFAKSFYKSKEWQAVREYALKRDCYLCVICGKPAEEVHHIIHLNPQNIYDNSISLNPDNLKSLCRECHFDTHKADKLTGIKEKNRKNKDCDEDYAFIDGMLTRINNLPPNF